MTEVESLVLARCAGFVFRAPGFAHPSVPAPVRAAFAYAAALAFASGLPPVHLAAPLLPFALAAEATLGAAVGTAAAALYDGAYAGGRLVDDYVGIRASVPTAGIVAGAGFGRLWSLALTACFFAFGGHRVLLEAFGATFALVPPGGFVAGDGLAQFVVRVPATLFGAATLVAGPALVVALTAQIALAGIARAVPRISTFALSFPIVLACALLATLAMIPAVLPVAGRPWLDVSPLRGR